MSITNALYDHVIEMFLSQGSDAELTAQTPLLEIGVLDSGSMQQLACWLEQEHGVKLGAHEITAENFGNLHNISATVARHLR
ncbi:MAG: phosphopantetheine-binding protein [Polyangiales bacterium]